MEAIGLMPSSTGKPGGARTGREMADYAIPGGLFMQATDKLLTQDFKISWLDRFPPMTTIAAPIADTGDGDGEGGDDLGDLISPLPGNRSNRVKYRCPSCGAQAWASRRSAPVRR